MTSLQTVVVDLKPGASQDDLMAALERAACVEQVVFMGPDNLVQVDEGGWVCPTCQDSGRGCVPGECRSM